MNNGLLKTNAFLLVAAVLAHVPIAAEYSIRMWRSGHYQFFPLLLLIAGWFYFKERYVIERNASPGNSWIVTIIFLLILSLATMAIVLNTSFVGAVSLWIFIGAIVYWRFGDLGIVRVAPLMFVLLFIIPLPVRMDQSLIFRMQVFASQLASWILDGMGFVHFREGVVLVTEKKHFLTEEACSGVRSLFSSLAGITLFGIMMRYSWWRHVVNLAQTLMWVIIGNAIRIAIVVLVTDRWTEAFASGIGHEFLGLLTFGLIMVMALSTDRLLAAIVPLPAYPENVTRDETICPVPESWKTFSKQSSLGWRTAVVGSLFLVLFLFGTRLLYERQTQTMGIAVFHLPRLPEPEENRMPPKIGRWNLVGFERISRGQHSLQAEDSFVWTYRLGNLQAQVSLDCPWDKWHDLSDCYSGIGWKTKSKHLYDVSRYDPTDTSHFGFSRIELSRPSGETGLVVFSALDRNANEVIPQFTSGFFNVQSVRRQFVANVSLALGLSVASQSRLAGIAMPVTIVQLLCTSGNTLDPQQQKQLEELFVESRAILAGSKRFDASQD